MTASLAELGVEYDGISQTEQYTVRCVPRADPARDEAPGEDRRDPRPVPHQEGARRQEVGRSRLDEAELEAAEGSGAAAEDDGSGGAAGYFPYKPYCGQLRARTSRPSPSYDDETTELTYTCTACGFAETVRLSEFNRGKLVWKVDWPMRWAYEGVIFEPSGVDHSSPGSSFVVGGQIVREIFDGVAADRPDVRVRRHLRHGEDVLLARRRADPGRRAEDHGAAAAALAVRAPQAEPVLQDRLRPGDPAALRRVGHAGRARSPTGRALPGGRRRALTGRRARPRASCRARRGRCRTARSPRSSTSPPGTTSRRCAS